MTTGQIQSEFANAIAAHIGREDDSDFWSTVFGTLLRDFELQHFNHSKKNEIFLQIGACSHWLRPHQTQLTADGGFAFPSGYLGGSDFSLNGLPEFDWYLILYYGFRKRGRECHAQSGAISRTDARHGVVDWSGGCAFSKRRYEVPISRLGKIAALVGNVAGFCTLAHFHAFAAP